MIVLLKNNKMNNKNFKINKIKVNQCNFNNKNNNNIKCWLCPSIQQMKRHMAI